MPACRSSASRKSIAIGSFVVASTSSRTVESTSCVGTFSRNRSASERKKWACSTYSSRLKGASGEFSASLDIVGRRLRLGASRGVLAPGLLRRAFQIPIRERHGLPQGAGIHHRADVAGVGYFVKLDRHAGILQPCDHPPWTAD